MASCATGTSTPKSSADGSDRRSTLGPLFLEQRGQGISRVVVNSSSGRSGDGQEIPFSSNDYRCFQQRMWCRSWIKVCKRSVVSSGIQATHQSPGATSSSQGGALLHMSSENEDDCSPPGQCHSNVLLEQIGWDKICCSEQTHSGYSEVLHNFNSSLPSSSGESGS